MLVNMNTWCLSFKMARSRADDQSAASASVFLGTLIVLMWVTLTLPTTPSFAAEGPETTPVQVLALGDSLTAGYGLGPGEGFVDQLNAWLAERLSAPVSVINAGVSGDTSSGGASRLDWSLAGVPGGKPDLVLLELGANDGLRGIDPTLTRANLDQMLASLAKSGIPVIVAGMLAPPNLGPDYAASFNIIYPELAAQYGATLYPFFLDGVAADPSLNQADGIHPTAEGVGIIVSRMGPVILSVLDPAGAPPPRD